MDDVLTRSAPETPLDGVPRGHVQSVNVVDDSENRPVKVRVISIVRPSSSTTLVISQGAEEKVTHIAWTLHYDLKPVK